MSRRQCGTEVIGWTTEVMDIGKGPYTVLKTGGRPVAGIMGKPPEAPAAMSAPIALDRLRPRRPDRSARSRVDRAVGRTSR